MATQSFLRHAAVYGFGTLLIHAASFCLLPLYTQYLSPTEYGVLEVLNRLAEVLVICLLFGGVRQATLAFHGQSKDDAERLRTTATLLVLLAVIALGGIGFVALTARSWSSLLALDDANLLRLAVAAALLEATMMLLLALCQARQESGLYVSVTVSQFLIRATLIVFLVVCLGWGVWGVLAASVLVPGLYVVGLAAREVSRGACRPDWARLRAMIAFALPLLPGGIGFFILNNGDRFFLLRYASEDAVGTYALGYKLALAVSLLGRTPFGMVWSARMYEAAKLPDAPVVFGVFFSRLVGAYLLVGLGMCLFDREITALIGGARYAEAARIIAPVVLAYLFLTAADLMDAGFYVQRRTWHKTWIVAISTATMLLLYALLIPRWHGLGSALATLGGFGVHACLTGIVSQRVFPVRYETSRLTGMLVLAVGLWLVSRWLPVGGWTLAVKLGLWALGPMLAWNSGLVSDEEKHHVGSLLRHGLSVLRPLRQFGGVR